MFKALTFLLIATPRHFNTKSLPQQLQAPRPAHTTDHLDRETATYLRILTKTSSENELETRVSPIHILQDDVRRSMVVPVGGADKCCEPVLAGILHHYVQRLGVVRIHWCFKHCFGIP